MTACHIERKNFQCSFGYIFDYIKQQRAPLVLIVMSMFIYNLLLSKGVEIKTTQVIDTNVGEIEVFLIFSIIQT